MAREFPTRRDAHEVLLSAIEKGDLAELQRVLEKSYRSTSESEPLTEKSEGEAALLYSLLPVGRATLELALQGEHWTQPWQVAQCLLKKYYNETFPHKTVSGSIIASNVASELLQVVSLKENAMYEACRQGLLEAVKYLHRLKYSITVPDEQGNLPFDIARSNAHLLVVQFLLKKEKYMVVKPDLTELHIVCILGNTERMRAIISSNRRTLAIRDRYDMTPVHYASCAPQAMKFIISVVKKRNINEVLCKRDSRGNAALHYAALTGCTASVKMILSASNRVLSVLNADDDTPLHLAIKSNYSDPDLVEALVLHETCRPSVKNMQCQTPLHLAARLNKLDKARVLLLSRKCSPDNIKGAIEEYFLLHQAVFHNEERMVKTILQNRYLNVNIPDSDGSTPLHIACRSTDSAQCAHLLAEYPDCDLNLPDKSENTPLHLAVKRQWLFSDLIQFLLKKANIFPNSRNKEGNTPLHEAVLSKASGVVRALVLHENCTPSIPNNEGKTPLFIAAEQTLLPFVDAIISSNKCSPEDVREACRVFKYLLHKVISSNRLSLLKTLIAAQICDINETKPQTKETPLHVACTMTNVKLITLLLSEDPCNLNAQDGSGNTALHIAVAQDPKISAKKVQHLTEDKRCDINIKNHEGNTALHVAVGKVAFEIVKMLVNHAECNPNIQNNDGNTALHLCIIDMLSLAHERMSQKSLNSLRSSQLDTLSIQDSIESDTSSLFESYEEIRFLGITERSRSFSEFPTQFHRSGSTRSLQPFSIARTPSDKRLMMITMAILRHKNVTLNAQNICGNTILHEAVKGHTGMTIFKKLVSLNTETLSRKNFEEPPLTPLHMSINYNRLSFAEAMVISRKCSDEDIVMATEGKLLLHRIIPSRKKKKLAMALIEFQGYKINERNGDNETPLHITCRTGDIAYLKTLARNPRCDLNAQNGIGETALHIAVCSQTESVQNVLCLLENDGCDLNIANADGHTPLHIAVNEKRADLSIVLVKNSNCRLDIPDHDGNTVLHICFTKLAIALNDFVAHIRGNTVSLCSQNKVGNTPIHEAILALTPVNVLEILLQLQENYSLSVPNCSGVTPLQMALNSNRLDYADVLIIGGKCSDEDIVKASEGKCLLHQTISSRERGKLAIALINMEFYNINETNGDGETPLHITCRVGDILYLKALATNPRCDLNVQNKIGETALHLAICSELDCVEKVQYILESDHCDLNVINHMGLAPLHIAVKNNYSEMTGMLLKSPKCNPNIQDSNGNSSLHLAVNKKFFPILELLLMHKRIEPNIQNQCGNTPLHEAVIRLIPIRFIRELLLHKSSEPSIINHDGWTPLALAVTSKKIEYSEALVMNKRCSDKDIQNSVKNTLLLHQALSLNRPDFSFALLNVHEGNFMNKINMSSETPLQVIANKNTVDYIEACIYNPTCDLNLQDMHGNTALHLAICTEIDSIQKVQCLVQSERCNPNIMNNLGYTPLHLSVRRNIKALNLLIQCVKCDPNIVDLDGNTPLHISIRRLSLSDVEQFLMNDFVDLNIQNNGGNTPLHMAVMGETSVDVVKVLTYHKHCNVMITNKEGMTPLRTAAKRSKKQYVEILLSSGKCGYGLSHGSTTDTSSFLHQAVLVDSIELLEILLEAGYNSNVINSEGQNPLHIGCKVGNHKSAELLIKNGVDIRAQDKEGNAPIHVACESIKLNCLEVLLGNKSCDLNQQNSVGDTALHILCRFEQSCDLILRMVHMLLSTPGIDFESINDAGQTPTELAKSNHSITEKIQELLQYNKSRLKTYLKVFVIGSHGAGKSTLIKAVTTEASQLLKYAIFPRAKRVNPSDVPPHTAGIVPIPFNSKHFGHAVLYDFAGQHEYYSSHAAVMENLILPSPPLFLLLIDISKPIEKIKEELVYWWHFINNHCQRAAAPPHVIFVASHKDKVRARGEDSQSIIDMVLKDSVRDIQVSFKFEGSFPMDCRKLVSRGLTALLTQLNTTCEVLRQTVDVDIHCHILKAFLTTTEFKELVVCQILQIIEKIKSGDALLPQSSSQLIPLLSTLSDQGHILVLQNHTDVNKNWVILKPEVLLAEVNGSIFAPDYFKEHFRNFAMSTGVVTLSQIREKFTKFHHEGLVEYLIHFEFCFRIKDKHTLELITKNEVSLTSQASEYREEYYFFPSLVRNENPEDVCLPQETDMYQCGWFYKCGKETEQLTTRFLHVLISRLAFCCEPPDDPIERESVALLRSCSVWKHGISWWTDDGLETIVEVGLQCRWVAVMMRCPNTHKVQCAELRSKVITIVLKAKQDFCPVITMNEFLIAPSSLKYPFEGRELTLYSMRDITSIVIEGKPYAKDIEGKKPLDIHLLLPFEPYYNLGYLCNTIFSASQSSTDDIPREALIRVAEKSYRNLQYFEAALQPNPIAYEEECSRVGDSQFLKCIALFEVLQRRGCKTWRDFEREFSRFSIFCGRNPMVTTTTLCS